MKMTENEFKEYRDSYDGYCTACKDVTRYGGTEPDAENYACEECDESKAMGMENALIMGYIDIV